MNEIFRNRLLPEYSRQELEEEFIRCCENLDSKATEILKLEKQAEYLEGRLGRLQQDVEDQTRQQVRFDGTHAPIAYRQSQLTVKELNDQIILLERELGQHQMKRDKVLQEVRYFRSLLNFPGKRSKAGTAANSGKKKTRAELARMLSVLLTNKQMPPQMVYRIQAAISILNHNLIDAEIPMRELMKIIGESLQLFDMLDKKKEIEERERQIENMRQKLAELRERHDKMTEEHQKLLQQYKDEAEQNNAKYKEILDLQQQREAKEAEAARLKELQIIADGLRSEINLLEEQKVKLNEDNIDRVNKLRMQMEEAIRKLKSELDELVNHCAALRASNKDLESRCADLERQYADAKDRKTEIEELSQQLQAEYDSLRKYYFPLLSQTNDDPFENPRFVEFLNQMGARDWRFSNIRDFQNEIEELQERRKLSIEKVAKYENLQTKLTEMIETKKNEIANLEEQLRKLQGENGIISQEVDTGSNQEYLEGSPDIFDTNIPVELNDDETAFMLHVEKFNLTRPEIIGPKRCKLTLSFDFYDHEINNTNLFLPSDTDIDSRILFPCKNDFQLREYVQKGKVKVQLVKMIGIDATPVGQDEFSLKFFLDDPKNKCFSSKLVFRTFDQNIEFAEANFQVGLYIPIIQ